MEPQERELRIYVGPNGRVPFEDWLRSVRDKRTKAHILSRIDRLRMGNFGDCEALGEGVYELRLHFGPGFRVYFGLQGTRLVLLLCGGSKNSQQADITRAKQYWREISNEYKEL